MVNAATEPSVVPPTCEAASFITNIKSFMQFNLSFFRGFIYFCNIFHILAAILSSAHVYKVEAPGKNKLN